MKASGSYASLVRGVSQQIPEDRQPGQHTEQVNLIPDPVQGLCRRHGSRFVAERDLGISALLDYQALDFDMRTWRTFDYTSQDTDFSVLHRTGASVVPGAPLMVFDKTNSTWVPVVRNAVDVPLDTLTTGGISAITSVGKYVFMAGNDIVPTASSVDAWGAAGNEDKTVLWVRGGAYARTFKVTATKLDNSQVSFEYTTPTSSYAGVLDTSGVPVYAADPAGGTTIETEACYIIDVAGTPTAELSWHAWNPVTLSAKKGATVMTNVSPAAPANSLQYAWVAGARFITFHSSNLGALDVSMTYTHTKTISNPNYTKTITDLTNAYNTAVTNWIGTAAEAIQPENIAEQLKLAAIAAGLAGTIRQAGTVIFDVVKAISVSDGGDGSLLRGVAQEVNSVDQVSAIHYVGKVVRVRARNSAESFYLIAEAKDGVSTGYTEVTWVEGAGTVNTITLALCYGVYSAGTFYIASSAALLNAILPGTHPTYAVSTSGDLDSSPLPFFIGQKITYLGVFQDRLLVGARAVLRCSKIGDYLNFFRSSVLTVPADDPLEMLSQGTEDDTLQFSVLYDRDLILFGDKRQYAVSGRTALTPTSSNMPVMSSHSNAAQAPPIAVGGVIFYGQRGTDASSLHQIQPGQNAESPETYNVSTQIDTYIEGAVTEIARNPKPTHVFMRTSTRPNDLYCFTYLDKEGQGRVQDAWGRWSFNAALGSVVGMSSTADGLLVYRLFYGIPSGGGFDTWIVADLCPMTTGLSSLPYLDSIRPYEDVVDGDDSIHAGTLGDFSMAFDNDEVQYMLGTTLALAAPLAAEFPSATGWVGADMECFVTLTNPFPKDKNDEAILTGRLTITKLIAKFKKSSGLLFNIFSGQQNELFTYNGRVLGDPNNLIGREVITDLQQSLPIGREASEYTATLSARKWLPFTLTSLQWIGQYFNRTQRF